VLPESRTRSTLASGEKLDSRVIWLRQRARAQLRHALSADNVYDKNERLSIAIILYDHAAAAAAKLAAVYDRSESSSGWVGLTNRERADLD
jgi:hypothetical protein